ncbi:hypothetical protein, partial [Sphingomonas hylomeconis]
MVSKFGVRATTALMAGTILSGLPVAASAQGAPPQTAPTLAPVPANVAPAVVRQIKTLRVEGSQRIEPDTVLSYTKLRVGQNYT